MRMTVRSAIAAAVLLAAAAGVVWSLWPRPTPVEAAVVTKGAFVATVDEDGRTRVRERFVVAAPLAGRLTRVNLKAGDRVASNETVATISPSPAPFLDPRSRREAQERIGAAEAALERANAAVERSNAQAEQAGKERTRTQALVERGASTQQALERAELAMRIADRDLRASEFQRHAAEHELAQAKALLMRYENDVGHAPESWNVTAPVPGVVLKVMQESETVVQAGTPILEMGDLRDLEVVVDVLSTEAVEIRPGAAVDIVNWGGDGTLRGRVRRVEPSAFTKVSTLGVEEQRVNVLIDIVSPPRQWEGLGDAYRVEARITAFTLDEATIVPVGALFRRSGEWRAFVIEDGRARERSLDVVRRSGRLAAIGGGLNQGERVIVYPSDRITAGLRVEPR